MRRKFATKRDQKIFDDGSLETAGIWLSIEKPVEKILRPPEKVRPSVLDFLNSQPLFHTMFVQMNIPLRKGIS